MRFFIDPDGFISKADDRPKATSTSNRVTPVSGRRNKKKRKTAIHSAEKAIPQPVRNPAIELKQCQVDPVTSAINEILDHATKPDLSTKRASKFNIAPRYDPLTFDARHPLYKAVEIGNVDAVEWLINDRRLLNIRGYNGDTPLHFAVLKGRVNIAVLLFRYGASLHTKNQAGQTPIMLAASLNQSEYCATLARALEKVLDERKAILYCAQFGSTNQPKLTSTGAIGEAMTECPQCHIKIRFDRLERHIKKAHTGATPAKQSDTPRQTQENRNLKNGRSRSCMAHTSNLSSNFSNDPETIMAQSRDFESRYDKDRMSDGSRGWGYAWRDGGSYGSYPGFDAMDDASGAD